MIKIKSIIQISFFVWIQIVSYFASAFLTPGHICPDGFILIPGADAPTNRAFCVAKYEMKCVGTECLNINFSSNNPTKTRAVSTIQGIPWVKVNRASALHACSQLGANYRLISNHQWQTIARNIASVSRNWSAGHLRDGDLNRGFSNRDSTFQPQHASVDSDPCFGVSMTCLRDTWALLKRTHLLSNGNVIWDFAGNASEWIHTLNESGSQAGGFISNINNAFWVNFGPVSNCYSHAHSPYCGFGYSVGGSSAGIIRGGSKNDGDKAGIFSVSFTHDQNAIFEEVGFRCVFEP